MSDLKQLQEDFQRAVLSNDDSVLAELVDTSRERREVLLGVYRNAYLLRLQDVLANDYEKLALYLGDDRFADMARLFVAENPSKTSNARWFGKTLPAFLKKSPPFSNKPVIGDLAALEKALNDVFDAEDDVSLTLADLGEIAAEKWPSLVFIPHPATRRLDFPTNAHLVWSALHEGKTPPEDTPPGETVQIIVSRADTMSTFRTMPSDEAMMWDEMSRGTAFSVLCEMLSIFGGEEAAAARPAGYLRQWIEAGMLADFKSAS